MKKLLNLLVLLVFLASCTAQSTPTPQEVTRVVVVTATSQPTIEPTQVQPNSTIAVQNAVATDVETGPNPTAFAIRSVDLMKYSQDVLRNPPDDEFMSNMVAALHPLNLTHLAISVPYDEPEDMEKGSAAAFAKRWVSAIRNGGLKVWFRGGPISFKGFYDAEIDQDLDHHLTVIRDYIVTNPDLFEAGDVFTPVPEPDSDRVKGINCFDPKPCLFENKQHLAEWMEQATETAKAAFQEIGLGDQVTVGRWGLNGFTVWGDNNPDWEGRPQTITDGQHLIEADDGTLCMDHYFGSQDPQQVYQKIRSFFPDVNLWVCEWGAADGQSPEFVAEVLQEAINSNIEAFNYWHSGPGGNEALLDNNLKPTPYFEVLKRYFNQK